MNGFLLIDKEKGINSFKLIVALRKLTGEKKVGYAGTLDPLATGLMIVALGEYTKLLPFLEISNKVYQAKIEFGKISDTLDADGKVQEVEISKIPSEQEIIELLNKKFLGDIEQIPPKFSAIKVNGKRAYDLARKGDVVELKSRLVHIFYTKVLSYQYPYLDIEIKCSSGTYIRSFADDLGRLLGVGGMITELRRIKISENDVSSALRLESLKSDVVDKFFVQPNLLFNHYFYLNLSEEQYHILARGNFIENCWEFEKIAFAFRNNQLVGVLDKIDNGTKLKFKRKLNVF